MAISDIKTEPEAFAPRWGDDAPKGARVVLGRIIKDGAKGTIVSRTDTGPFAPRYGLQQHHLSGL